jgi:iron-sulfur cluster assembly accessory protein
MNIELSERAKKALIDLGVTENKYFRIKVVTGGCSGRTYSAGIDDKMTEDDILIYESERLKVIADFNSVLYLYGLQVDYSDDLIKAGFRFNNPMAQKSCGCGASFKV